MASVFIFILASCSENKKETTPGYPFLHTSSDLLREISDLTKNGTAPIENLNKFKSDKVVEFYVAPSELKLRQGQGLISNETSILALITDGKGGFEIWQVNPIQVRISYNVDGQKSIAPYPYSSKKQNY